jgi:hypothetical protein
MSGSGKVGERLIALESQNERPERAGRRCGSRSAPDVLKVMGKIDVSLRAHRMLKVTATSR